MLILLIIKYQNQEINSDIKNDIQLTASSSQNEEKSAVKAEYIHNKQNLEHLLDEEVLQIKKFVSIMKENYTNLNFDREFKEKIIHLYEKNKNMTNILKSILVNTEFTNSEFNEDQAYARVFSIKALKEIAIQFDKAPLIETINDVKDVLQKNIDHQKGRDADLEDLLTAYVSVFDIENFSNNIEDHLIQIGFNKENLKPDIYNIYDNAIFFSLYPHFNREKAKKIMNQYFN